ncbi:MAG: hypothetical protein SYNGOMJ08_00704 [Candidatus Syntrophoarchaeum sp. GoM_oil]|nr:MAG: hypothetical protein SYNGOMJ08_00704 [Candidatus Syntrophoarchaeum sp. GoM_oil]
MELENIGKAKLIISRKNQKDASKYYICTDTSLSAVEILSIYEDKWNIETGHRESNQKLGFKDYQMRGKEAIERFIQLVFSVWTALLLMDLENEGCTIWNKFRQDSTTRTKNHYMVLGNDDVQRIALRVVDYEMNTQLVADQFKISRRRVQQLAKEYRETGKAPRLKKRGAKPKRCDDSLRREVIAAKRKLGGSAVLIGKYLRRTRQMRIDNNRIHAILLEEKMAEEDDKKKRRKRLWVRYERSHNLSAVHMDWYLHSNGEWICAVLDDASRMILAAWEFDHATADNSIKLLDEAYHKYLHIAPIREVKLIMDLSFTPTREIAGQCKTLF